MVKATPLNQVMLQMPGVALDQNQEIHIRGEHMGIQYQMNGITPPLDIDTDPTFTQLLNAYFIKSVSLMDGVLPMRSTDTARQESSPSIPRTDATSGHNDFTVYGGQRDTAQGAFQLGGCGGDFSYYLTGLCLRSRTWASNLRSQRPNPIHDAVTQGQGFAYLTYTLNPTTKLSLITGMTLSSPVRFECEKVVAIVALICLLESISTSVDLGGERGIRTPGTAKVHMG